MVELARAQVPAARFEQADVLELPDTAARWDAITVFFPLLQMPRTDLDTVLARVARWLRPGGWLVFATVPSDLQDAELAFMGRPVRVTSYPAAVFGQRLRAAGLQILHEEITTFQPDFPDEPAEDQLFLYAHRPARIAAG